MLDLPRDRPRADPETVVAIALIDRAFDATRIHRVFGGGTLSGSGRIASSVTVHPGGTLDGSHVSTNALTIGGALKLKRGSSLAVDLGRQTHEALQVAGAVTNEGADLRLALA